MNKQFLRTAIPTAQLRAGRTDWYRIENKAATSSADLLIYGEIGGYFADVDANSLVGDLAALDAKNITVHLNSPGGSAFDGIAIMNALINHKATVDVQVAGIAASAASVIAMGGDTVTMQLGSQMMIHEASGICIGNSAAMRDMQDVLDAMSDNIAAIYASRAGGNVADWRTAMAAETWYSAQEAVDAGLATAVGNTSPRAGAVSNSFDLSIFKYTGRDQAPAPTLPVNHAPVDAPEFDPDSFRKTLEGAFA